MFHEALPPRSECLQPCHFRVQIVRLKVEVNRALRRLRLRHKLKAHLQPTGSASEKDVGRILAGNLHT